MAVIKRDGAKVAFDETKVFNAIIKAMRSALPHEVTAADEAVVGIIARLIKVEHDVAHGDMSIQDIENRVFELLTDKGYSLVAIKYIEHKTVKSIERQKHLLTDAFLDKYPDYPDDMDNLARFVYIRTYSRWLPDKNRRETWKETCARAVNGNCSYLPTEYGEAEKLFDNMFHCKQRVSGRMLWLGGTEALEKTPLAAYNCSGMVMDNMKAFSELFYLLMVGTGVGIRVLIEDVAKLPALKGKAKLYHTSLKKPEGAHLEHTETGRHSDYAVITVGDSKEGWCEALDAYLEFMQDETLKGITIDYTYIRPQGAPLRTFGGYASGSGSLKDMFTKIHNVITNESTDGVLRPINVADICNMVGQNVVAGGTRRTAELVLFSPEDEEMLHAKENLDEAHYHRFMSNNSMYLTDKPSKEHLREILKSIKETGEPGFVNANNAKARRADFDIVNPCSEILLPNKAVCNLTNINVSKFVNEFGLIMFEELEEACKLSARACYRLTEPTLELPGWAATHHKDRLIGCSITGWQDFVQATHMPPAFEKLVLGLMKEWVIKYADEYATSLNRPKPVLHTTVQPDGTGGLISNCSAGIHWQHAPYYYRRVRISSASPLFKAIEGLNWKIDNEVGQGDDGHTKVITFPCKTNATQTKYDVSAIDQLECYKRFQEKYVEHNTSITVTVKEHEWDDVCEWLYNNWDCVVGISFLTLDQTYYPLMPYETCTKEEYEALKAQMLPLDQSLVNEWEFKLQSVGQDFELDGEDTECENGICSIK